MPNFNTSGQRQYSRVSSTPAKVFVGQRKEPRFEHCCKKIFDLFNLNPLGPGIGWQQTNDLEGKTVRTIWKCWIARLVAARQARPEQIPWISAYTYLEPATRSLAGWFFTHRDQPG
jgi:hypothetical protein